MLELTRSHVRLRLRVAAFATETGRELLSRALSSYFEARRALIEGFRNDPFVKQVQALFHGTIDDTTVKANTD